jgi:hypothetical protein
MPGPEERISVPRFRPLHGKKYMFDLMGIASLKV